MHKNLVIIGGGFKTAQELEHALPNNWNWAMFFPPDISPLGLQAFPTPRPSAACNCNGQNRA
jgi:hypothetical protein